MAATIVERVLITWLVRYMHMPSVCDGVWFDANVQEMCSATATMMTGSPVRPADLAVLFQPEYANVTKHTYSVYHKV